MRRNGYGFLGSAAALTALLLGGFAPELRAEVIGITPNSNDVINLTARCDFISTGDGNSLLIWGYAPGRPEAGTRAQYPGPTLILQEGQTVTINLFNQLTDEEGQLIDQNVSLMFPGHTDLAVTATDWLGVDGLLTREAVPGGQVRYRFTADHPGTYMYHSGTSPQLQLEMGLFGAIVVRPTGGLAQLPGPNDPTFGFATSPGHAYNDAASAFEREHLFILSEMDPEVHFLVEIGAMDQIDLSGYFPVYWFINGRNAPDVFSPTDAFWLPTQPYNIVPRALPGERLLLRLVGASRDRHPFHHHGDHARIVARDGRLLSSGAGNGPDLAIDVFTTTSVPGETVDAILDWMPYRLGWDVYGPDHPDACEDLVDNRTGAASPDGFDDGGANAWEWCEDHGLAVPTILPGLQDLTFGGFWSGSPYLGQAGLLPVGEGGLNPTSAFTYPWHSHTEKELTSFDIFLGGMLTIFFVEAPGVTDIPQSAM